MNIEVTAGAEFQGWRLNPQLISRMEIKMRRKAIGIFNKEVSMKLTKTNWNQLLSKIEDTWFYLRNPSLFFMSFERVQVRHHLNEDLIDYDLEA